MIDLSKVINNFYCMRSKLQSSVAELYKLKNQIRVELNQIRPRGSPLNFQKREHSAKRLYPYKYAPTDIVHPSAEKSQEGRDRKRYFNKGDIQHCENNRSSERKHYGRHYSDSVDLEMSVKRKTSSYLNIRKDTCPSPIQEGPCSTSLQGIGMQDRSIKTPPRLCIRIYHNRETSIC